MGVSIVLDAGHGGYDNGATYGDRAEKVDVLALTLAVGEILQNQGYDVTYTRSIDEYDSPYEKAQIANRVGADLFVSIHRNSSPTANQYQGVQSLVYSLDEKEAATLGDDINANLAKLGFQNLGLDARPGLVVLRRTQMPSILLEVGFLNNDTDNALFDSKFNEIAKAIADGIMTAYPLTANTETTQAAQKEYAVQVGLFRYESNAKYQKEILSDAGFTAVISFEDPYYAVRIPTGSNLEDAVYLQARLKRMGYDTLIVTM